MSQMSTKEKILEAAFKLFSERSFSAVTMDDIAREAGLSKGALFHHFNNKEELGFESVFKGFMGEFQKFSPVLKGEESAERKLREIVSQLLDIYIKKPKIMRFLIEMYEMTTRGQDRNKELQKWAEYYSELIALLDHLLSECQIPDSKSKAHLLGACIDGLAFQFLLASDGMLSLDIQELEREIIDVFLRK